MIASMFMIFIRALVGASCALGLLVLGSLIYLNTKLPEVEILKDMPLQVPLKIYTQDKKLIAEYGDQRRNPVSLKEVSPLFIQALLSTEDHRFYEHSGVDLRSLLRATVSLITTGIKKQGGSTISMQVARNFFLTRQKTYSRKFNEILLALKIENELSKDEILELYINKIFLGKRAYGIGAAAEVYYGKTINELTLSEMAMIAGLAKAPTAINPLNSPMAAIKRRKHVLSRMLNYGYITNEQFIKANNSPLTASYHSKTVELEAPYIAETVRQELHDLYGDDVYTKGYEVYTTINSDYQRKANYAIRDSLLAYDKRHGFRGPIYNWPLSDNIALLKTTLETWQDKLKEIPVVNKLAPAVVTSVNDSSVNVLVASGNIIAINFNNMQWARRQMAASNKLGPKPDSPEDILTTGDVIYIEQDKRNNWLLSQVPQVEGAIVAIDPHSGAILSLVGGFDYWSSRFNRATQASRQPGSNFKPFLYSAALEKGFTLASLINDAPIVTQNNSANDDYVWRPQNYTRKFYGPTRLRLGLTKSRNLVSIRLLKAVGIDNAINFVSKFGFNVAKLPRGLSLALGTGNVTPLELAEGYCVFANGGSRVPSYLISKIENYNGDVIFQNIAPKVCPTTTCNVDLNKPHQVIAERVLSPQVAYLISSALQDAINTGTGRRALALGRKDLAGKTGTTNDLLDAWYSGYNDNLVVTTWVGFDEPKSLNEYAASIALPMWMSFVGKVLKNSPNQPPPQPEGMVTIRIDSKTGELSYGNHGIYEVFREQYSPKPKIKTTVKQSNNFVEENSLETIF